MKRLPFHRRAFALWIAGIGLWCASWVALACNPHFQSNYDGGGTHSVPGVIGDSESTAVECLQQSGYQAQSGGQVESDAPAGTVVRIDPPEGSTPISGTSDGPGPAVTYWLSSGGRGMTDVVGDNLLIATVKLLRHHFQLGSVTRVPSDHPPNTILSQSIEPGTPSPQGTTLDVTVADEYPTVPDVVGRREPEASGVISEKFSPNNAGQVDSPLQAGTVLRTDPKGGTRVAPGSPVSYWVASGRNPVPDVRTRTRGDAQHVLQASGFALGLAQDRVDLGEPGRVLEQQPAPGTVADVGTPVAVWLSSELRVPNVVGQQMQVADEQLAALHLRGQIGGETPSPRPRGWVLATDPVAGTRVLENAIVRYRITSGSNEVPKVVGMHTAAAASTLAEAGFQLGNQTAKPDPGPQDIVLVQAPSAATTQHIGGRIDVVVSSDLPIVPNVVGQNQADAERRMREALFAPLRAGEESSTKPRGTVLRTDPLAGHKDQPQTSVRYWVASGKNVVPDLMTLGRGDADKRAADAGFRLGGESTAYRPQRPGEVMAQSPAAGTLVDLGTPIEVTLSIDTRRVPPLVDKTLQEAKADITAAGLQLAPVRTEYRFNSEGVVLAQQPAAGTDLTGGQSPQVAITVSKRMWPFVAGSSLLLVALLAGGWWTQLRPWPWHWPPKVGMHASLAPATAPWPQLGPLAHDPKLDVRLRVAIVPGDTVFLQPLPILRTEVRNG